MAILTHGSDLSLAPTLTPVVRHTGGTVREALTAIARGGFTAVQLDATLKGIRPRELDHRARRDLQALVARHSVAAAGLDLFIPRRHYVQEQHADRAMQATLEAIRLAADLGRLPVSVALPVTELDEDLRRTLVEAADGHSVRLAVHAEDQLDALGEWVDEVDLPALGAAIDPAALIAQNEDPAAVAQNLGARLTVARLSDASAGRSAAEPARCAAGRGELELTAYRVSVDLAQGRTGPVVLDLRGLENPLAAAQSAAAAWSNAGVSI